LGFSPRNRHHDTGLTPVDVNTGGAPMLGRWQVRRSPPSNDASEDGSAPLRCTPPVGPPRRRQRAHSSIGSSGKSRRPPPLVA
jgi:hypothetical protein